MTMDPKLARAAASVMGAVRRAYPGQAPVMAYSGVRKNNRTIRGSVSVVLISNAVADALDDTAAVGDGERLTFLIPRNGIGAWVESLPPQIGDVFTSVSGDKWSLTNVRDVRGAYYRAEAKEC